MKHFIFTLLLLSNILPASYAQHIVVQKTTGIAPMGSHFTVGDTDWSVISSSDYEWVFPGGDTVIGYQAVHTFIENGWVYLTITRADHSIIKDSLMMSVTPADSGFGAIQTYCISSSGDFGGCPPGANEVMTSNVASLPFAPNNRYLFRKGDTFHISGSKTMPYLTYYSSYGTAAEPPLIMVSGDATTTTFWMADDVSVSDIDFQGVEWLSSEAWGGSMYGEGRLFAPENNATFLNLNIRNMTSFAIMDDGIGSKKNLVIDHVNATNLGSYFLYAGPSPSMEYSGIRNSKAYNVLSNHGIRMNGGRYFTVNDMHIDSVDRSHITFRGLRYGIVSDSRFTGKGLYKNSIRNVSDDASTTDSVMYIIFERNQYSSRNNEFGIDLNIGNDVVIRNNLFLNSGLNVGINLSGVVPQHIEILHNTFYQNNYDWYSMVTLRPGASGIFKGNIAYADDCITSDCMTSSPFPAHSATADPEWQIDYNAYFVNGDAGGLQFKNGMGWTAWQALGNDEHSAYGSMSFINKSASIPPADFKPVSGVMLEIAPFLTHRDLHKIRRDFTGNNEAGAIQLFSPMRITEPSIAASPWICYPNPAGDFIQIQSVKNTLPNDIAIRVYDNSGKEVLYLPSFSIHSSLDISKWKRGMYILNIRTKDQQQFNTKFIKR